MRRPTRKRAESRTHALRLIVRTRWIVPRVLPKRLAHPRGVRSREHLVLASVAAETIDLGRLDIDVVVAASIGSPWGDSFGAKWFMISLSVQTVS